MGEHVGEPAEKRVTYAEYVARAAASDVKLEYIQGTIVAMSGGTLAHARLCAAVTIALGRALEGKPCVVLSSDARVRIRAADRATYPDVSVACGELEQDPDDPLSLINPVVLVEVTSPSSERNDRTEKFSDCRRLPSLAEYVVVHQARRCIEVYRREGRRWVMDEYGPGEEAVLESLGIRLDVDAVYFDPLA
jgi:Uma2 family endonuclease